MDLILGLVFSFKMEKHVILRSRKGEEWLGEGGRRPPAAQLGSPLSAHVFRLAGGPSSRKALEPPGSAGGRGFLPASMAPRVASACVRALRRDTATCREAQLGSEVGGFWLWTVRKEFFFFLLKFGLLSAQTPVCFAQFVCLFFPLCNLLQL